MRNLHNKNIKLETYNNTTSRQIRTCYLTLIHKKKQMVCKVFVVPESGPALLSIPDKETLGVLTIKYETIGRQLTQEDNPDKRQRNCQSERAVQTEVGKPESCTNKSRMLMYKNSAMLTIHLIQVLLLLQLSWVQITLRIAFSQGQ